jgi:hypothetical protein
LAASRLAARVPTTCFPCASYGSDSDDKTS